MGYETYEKDSYHITFGMIGGRKNRYNSPDHEKPSEPRKQGKHPPQGGTGHNTTTNNEDDEDDDDDDDENDDNNHSGQSQPLRQEVVFQPTTGAYATPYPYQYPPPPYPNQLAVGGYHADYYHHHVPGYPVPSFVPNQGGYGNHGGRHHMKDVGLVGVGAAIGVASIGMFKVLRERRHRYGGHY